MRVFDLHCDTATACCEQGVDLNAAGFHATLQQQAPLRAQCFALYVADNRKSGESGEEQLRRYLQYYNRQMQRLSHIVSPCRSAAEVEAAWQSGKHAAILTVENGAAFSGKMENLHLAAENGVKVVGLTWNGENELGFGSVTDQKKGLKPFGKAVVSEMRALGILPDISHLSDAGVEDLFRLDDGAVLATHSNLRSVRDVPRNLTEQQFCELVRRGGLVGLNLFVHFLGEDNETPLPLLRHTYRMLELGGENTVCLGCDMDGADLPPYMRGAGDFPELFSLFCSELGADTAERIFWRNAEAFFRRQEAGA